METSQSVPDLVATAQTNAKVLEDRISEILNQLDGQDGSFEVQEDLRAATVALELVAVDIFTAFEARMQHHFRRGPFSRKLNALLIGEKKKAFAKKFHQYYLAINVLKHGTGASYRELLAVPNPIFSLKSAKGMTAEDGQTLTGLVDVTVPNFFDGLTEVILEAYHFLEKVKKD